MISMKSDPSSFYFIATSFLTILFFAVHFSSPCAKNMWHLVNILKAFMASSKYKKISMPLWNTKSTQLAAVIFFASFIGKKPNSKSPSQLKCCNMSTFQALIFLAHQLWAFISIPTKNTTQAFKGFVFIRVTIFIWYVIPFNI